VKGLSSRILRDFVSSLHPNCPRQSPPPPSGLLPPFPPASTTPAASFPSRPRFGARANTLDLEPRSSPAASRGRRRRPQAQVCARRTSTSGGGGGRHGAGAGADPAADDQLLPSPDPDPARPAEEGAQRGGVAGAATILPAGGASASALACTTRARFPAAASSLAGGVETRWRAGRRKHRRRHGSQLPRRCRSGCRSSAGGAHVLREEILLFASLIHNADAEACWRRYN
jgi:hypothetical protein